MLFSYYEELEKIYKNIPHYQGHVHAKRLRNWTHFVQVFCKSEMDDQLFRANHWMLESPLHAIVSKVFVGKEMNVILSESIIFSCG